MMNDETILGRVIEQVQVYVYKLERSISNLKEMMKEEDLTKLREWLGEEDPLAGGQSQLAMVVGDKMDVMRVIAMAEIEAWEHAYEVYQSMDTSPRDGVPWPLVFLMQRFKDSPCRASEKDKVPYAQALQEELERVISKQDQHWYFPIQRAQLEEILGSAPREEPTN